MAGTRPASSKTDNQHVDLAEAKNGGDSLSTPGNSREPMRFHTLRAQASILSLLISESRIFAGTQNGDLLVWSLETYELFATVHAHRGGLLSLHLSSDCKLLFSSGGDALVNVWDTSSLQRLYSVWSNYDIGDVFCVVYSSELQTVYLGAQNTSIQWYDLSKKDLRPIPDLASHPFHRNHRFFDSKGPGGISTPRSASADIYGTSGGRGLNIDKEHIVQYAHFGYVYCMILCPSIINRRNSGEILISGGGDGSIKLWSIDSSAEGSITERSTLSKGDASILTLALDGTLLYSGRLEGDVDIWDLDTSQLIWTLKEHTEDVLTVSVGHNLIFTGSSNGIAKIFNPHYTKTGDWRAHDHLILASAVTSLNGKELYVTGGNDGTVVAWDVSDFFDRPSRGRIASNVDLVLALQKFVSYQTVSSRPRYIPDCRQGASFLRSLFEQFGAETDLLSTDEGMNPIVFARFRGKQSRAAKRKTVLFYGHYDVVSADNASKSWRSDPFELQAVNGILYGRGTSDNKGPVLAALYAVADVVRNSLLEADIVFLIEGEEESGSRGFAKAVKKHKKMIGDIDWILLANSYWLTDNIPCLTYGLRGIVRVTVEISSERPDLHSGVDGSHQLNEAMKDLVAVLASLTDDDGRVSIRGFYDRIPMITKMEEEYYETISKSLLQQNTTLGDVKSLKASLKAKWREPSLTIHRVHQSGSASSSIIPHAARADVSIRLVPKQTTDQIFKSLRNHIEDHFRTLKSSNTLKATLEHQAEPWLGDPQNHIFRVLEAAIMEAWAPMLQRQYSTTSPTSPDKALPLSEKMNQKLSNTNPRSPPLTSTLLSGTTPPISPIGKENQRPLSSTRDSTPTSTLQKPLYIREGGSIPAIRFLEQEFNAPAAHLPCGQASDSAHLDNEHLRLLNLTKSREIFRKVFIDLGKG